MNFRPIAYIIFFFLLFGSCIFPFDPPSEDYENLLVVEAFLTDAEEIFEVRLSRSIPINTQQIIPEENALISLSDNTGSFYDLYEESPGRYLATPDFQGQVGRFYQLHIQTSEGRQYVSDTVYMRMTPPIDSVFYILTLVIK